eukprot:TRINITY_DN31328_c0_g1_i1.p1 TRINITY_DN31328_c0_g1~~TRINITY_DN31328_c0_g1_i1.p1  ORF type:complete len:641 (-),score=135.10 TRINITY_DN31328_c0_g1_i1:53-1975(-)
MAAPARSSSRISTQSSEDSVDVETKRRVSVTSSTSVSSLSSAQVFLAQLYDSLPLPGQSKFNRSSSRSALTAGFIKGDRIAGSREWSRSECRTFLKKVMASPAVNVLFGIVILADSILTGREIDLRASNDATPTWLYALVVTFLSVYAAEFLSRLYLKRSAILEEGALIVLWDVFVLSSGALELILSLLQTSNQSTAVLLMVRLVRICRVLRLCSRLCHKFKVLKEIRRMVQMFGTCFKTLCWAFVFCFAYTTVWAMVLVELVDPLMPELAGSGAWPGCDRCAHSFSSVMMANLTLFQMVVVGDSWSLHATPVIEAHPWTAVIFVGATLTLVLGVLNLVVAVVVDAFAEQRQKNLQDLAQELDDDQEEDQRSLRQIFDRIDRDENGELSLEEILHGARQCPEFQSRLRVMDIDENDLEQLFEMLDVDNSGGVNAEEFIDCLSRWLTESKTATRFVKYNMMRVMAQQADLLHKVQALESQSTRSIRRSATLKDVVSDVLRRKGRQQATAVEEPEERKGTQTSRPLPTLLGSEESQEARQHAALMSKISEERPPERPDLQDLLQDVLRASTLEIAQRVEHELAAASRKMEKTLADCLRSVSLGLQDHAAGEHPIGPATVASCGSSAVATSAHADECSEREIV